MRHTPRVASSVPPPPSDESTARVKTLQLPDAPHASAGPTTPPEGPRSRFAVTSRTAWLIPPAFLFAALLGVGIVMQGPIELYGFALAALFGVGVLWLLISMFFPGKADLGCPRCKEEALERMSLDSVTGIRCASCGYEDAAASSWMIAEREGVPLEGIVMENRARRGAEATTTSEAN
jgi:hypothetical protein